MAKVAADSEEDEKCKEINTIHDQSDKVSKAESDHDEAGGEKKCWRSWLHWLWRNVFLPNEELDDGDKIDAVARVIFPIIFVILNVVYWTYYLPGHFVTLH